MVVAATFGIGPERHLEAFQNPGGTAVIAGTVTDEETGAPVAGGQVFLSETRIGVLTDLDGRFRLEEVPAGRYEVVVRLIGYMERSDSVTVGAGDVVELSFELIEALLRLPPIICEGCDPIPRYLSDAAVRSSYLTAAKGPISAGETISGSLSAADSVGGTNSQVWLLDGTGGDTVTTTLFSPDFAPYLIVFGPGLEAIAAGSWGSRARLRVALPESGVYALVITSYWAEMGNAGEEGRFTLGLRRRGSPKRHRRRRGKSARSPRHGFEVRQ